MPEAPLQPESPLQSQIAQMALDLARQLEQQAKNAPRGTVLAACEALLLDQGRQFLRDTLAATLQDQIDDAQKKGAQRVPAHADTPARTKATALASK